MSETLYGYNGKILRIDLSSKTIISESLDEPKLKKYIGGATLGIKFISDEVPPGIEWSDSANRLFLGTGPLTGTRISGSGSTAVVRNGDKN